MTDESRPPFPPFSLETALKKIKAAEDAWNARDPQRVSMAYTPDSEWRNRNEFIHGRAEIKAFLERKWAKELDYRLQKELWCFADNRIAVRFEYEYHDAAGQWFRAYGNENWEFADDGLMQRRYASINDLAITEADRKLRWERSADTSQSQLAATSIDRPRTAGPDHAAKDNVAPGTAGTPSPGRPS